MHYLVYGFSSAFGYMSEQLTLKPETTLPLLPIKHQNYTLVHLSAHPFTIEELWESVNLLQLQHGE